MYVGSFKIPDTYVEALQLAADLEEERAYLEKENKRLTLELAKKDQVIRHMSPKASYYDLILQTKSVTSISQIAKDYSVNEETMNQWLHELGVQYEYDGCWLLNTKHQNRGYTQNKIYATDEGSVVHAYWTQKGRTFIYERLKQEKQIVPLMERKAEYLVWNREECL
ncbi:phage antirepressor KilAC domain-containing protein [Shouchella lonarensis]|uniref:Phage antirepressor protein YoqD, KilAC domain n=1 Tax=Shouchella lonarensis TaxID=1464122 RepID=A0A1G6HRZ5_9BACI|nr:phage antirepressor KilAC domain-containing protein [Shouchella lonarensis]SDB96918.1 Phage antirepressor protein YoqD, KilAC domain [Shouchella lonarensis]